MKPTINMGDIIITGPLNGEVKPGTIVTYELGKALVTHRALSVDGDTLVTKGDAMEDPDPRPVTISQVVGVYLFKIPNIGYLSNFIRTKPGWFGIVILPAMVLVSFIVKDVVKEALRPEPEPAISTTKRITRITSVASPQHNAVAKAIVATPPVTKWYDPWCYRRGINIPNSHGALTDVKVKLAINTQELIRVRRMQPDGSDICFTKADGVNRIQHWIESGINTTSTIIWVRIPSIPSGGTTVYLYYGNPASVSTSDRPDILTFNHDFEKQLA